MNVKYTLMITDGIHFYFPSFSIEYLDTMDTIANGGKSRSLLNHSTDFPRESVDDHQKRCILTWKHTLEIHKLL